MSETWFRDRLKELGCTQRQMAVATGLGEAALSRALRGERRLMADEAIRIAAFLDVSIEAVAQHVRRASEAA